METERDDSCVKVAVRIRPLLSNEDESCIVARDTCLQIGGSSGPRFTFDQVLQCSQADLFKSQIVSLVDKCLEGYNATILAYGQTGSGKTHTILGNVVDCSADDPQAGIIPRALAALFDKLSNITAQQNNDDNNNDNNHSYSVSLQFLELYGEEIRDLLTNTKSKLTIRDLGNSEPEVVGATQRDIVCAEQGLQFLSHGMLRRVTGATAMNESSSRSHAIITVHVQQTISGDADDDETILSSKFSFVDLAGAERQKRTQATGKRLQEGIDINKGLSNLGNVISALGDPKKIGKTHVPYRDAKLTRLLKGSLGGNHKTLMIACVSPAFCNLSESLNCLRYANRAKNIQNTAVINVDSHTRKLQELQNVIHTLGHELLYSMDGNPLTLSREQIVGLLGGYSGGISSSTPVKLPSSVNTPTTTSDLARQLQISRQHHDAAEQEVVKLRGEKARADIVLKQPTDLEQQFIKRAEQYEQEIVTLQRTLQSLQQKIASPLPDDDGWDEEFLHSQEELAQRQKEKLSSIRAALHIQDENELNASNGSLEEDDDDHNQTEALASKYLGSASGDDLDDSTEVATTKVVEEALVELSQNIKAKEKLIDQIKKSKEREAMMRLFYEEKLNELQQTLVERENERDQLVKDLEVAKEANNASEELQSRLLKKQEQIDALKKMQQDYRKQTAESKQKTADLNRLATLQSEVKSMKRRKADMQKELAHEKRSHARELNKLNKMVGQKEREINKIKKVSTQHEIEAEKAKTVSKNRLMELSQLKKTLRLYKKGIGLDPVLVGRRQSSHPRPLTTATVDVDRVRDFFDQKVAAVVRKEALVDKMASEWEEYFYLNTQLEEVDRNDPDSEDTLQALQVQIQFVNDKIRKTGKRLRQSKAESAEKGALNNQEDGFLFDNEFSDLCSGTEPEKSRSAAAKVLFGMVVRERRRVSALAKTASSLDERLQQAEKAAEVSESALRSHMEDHREEVAEINRQHMEHLLSLMNMVSDKPRDSTAVPFDEDDMPTEHRLHEKLLVFSSERVTMLETQLADLQMESNEKEEYLSQLEKVKASLSLKTEECDNLERSRNDLRSLVRQIRDEVSKVNDSSVEFRDLRQAIVDMVDEGLHSEKSPSIKKRQSLSGRPSLGSRRDGSDWVHRTHGVSPRLKNHIEAMHSSDSDSGSVDEDEPEWAENIMNDLALIAEGKVPPGLEDISAPNMDNITIRKKKPKTVFDRLTNPYNFTGTQKARREIEKDTLPPLQDSENKRGSDFVSPTNNETAADLTPTNETHKSVFDRLCSPSHFTGTQKEKFQETQAKRERAAEESADRVLDVLLDEGSNHESPLDRPFQESHGHHVPPDYAKMDVFDRLQKTTTQAAAAKQIEIAHQDSRTNQVKGQRSSSPIENNGDTTGSKDGNSKQRLDPTAEQTGSPEDEGRNAREAYTKQNVFDRLQKTVTQATAVRRSRRLQEARSMDVGSTSSDPVAKKSISKRRSDSAIDASSDTASKKGHSKRGSDPSADGSSETSSQKGGSRRGNESAPADASKRQNVFERLTSTTTEAYALKTNRANN